MYYQIEGYGILCQCILKVEIHIGESKTYISSFLSEGETSETANTRK